MKFQLFACAMVAGLAAAGCASAASFSVTSGFSLSLDAATFTGGGTATQGTDFSVAIETDPGSYNYTDLELIGDATGTDSTSLPSATTNSVSATLDASGQADLPTSEAYFDAELFTYFDVTNDSASDITFSFVYSLFGTTTVGPDTSAGVVANNSLFVENADTRDILYEAIADAYTFNLGPSYSPPAGPYNPDVSESDTFSITLGAGETMWLTLRSYVSAGAVNEVPLPAAGWLLLAGIGGLLGTRRRA